MHWFGEVYITLSNEKPFQDVGATLPVDVSKGLLLHIKGFKPEGVAIGDWAEDLPVSLAHKETYRELSILGEDSFCLEYTWQCGDLGPFTEDSGLGDVGDCQSPPARGTLLEWGPVV